MRLYKRRWLIASLSALLILVLGYECLLQTILDDYANLQTRELHLQKQLRQRVSKVAAVPTPQSSLLQKFLLVAASQQTEIHSLVSFANTGVDAGEYYRVILRGKDVAVMGLLSQLSHYVGEYELGNIVISPIKNKWIEMECVVHIADIDVLESISDIKLDKLHNPFCYSEDVMVRMPSADITVRYPLQQLRLLGVVRRADSRDAVIEFPDGNVQVIQLHALLGSDQGRVTNIELNKMTLTLPNQTQHFLFTAN